jgi:hypothetical protein
LNLKIDLKEDAELRSYIKDLIKGQVLSIARGEINQIIDEVLRTKITEKIKTEKNFIDNTIKEHISHLVFKALEGWGNDYRIAVKNELTKQITDIINRTLEIKK